MSYIFLSFPHPSLINVPFRPLFPSQFYVAFVLSSNMILISLALRAGAAIGIIFFFCSLELNNPSIFFGFSPSISSISFSRLRILGISCQRYDHPIWNTSNNDYPLLFRCICIFNTENLVTEKKFVPYLPSAEQVIPLAIHYALIRQK